VITHAIQQRERAETPLELNQQSAIKENKAAYLMAEISLISDTSCFKLIFGK
jgi:hypothetical protein